MGRRGGVGDGPSDAGARGGPRSGPHYPGIAVSVGHAAGSLTCISAGQPPASPSRCSQADGGAFLSSGPLYREAPSTVINMTPGHPSPCSGL